MTAIESVPTAMRMIRFLVLVGLGVGLCAEQHVDSAEYDPLAIPNSFVVKTRDIDVIDAVRDRVIPIRIYIPGETSPQPVILFSHGLGGDRDACRYLGEHWSARGYVAVFMQHPGSDSAIWKDVPIRRRMAAIREAASMQNFAGRIQDVKVVLDQLTRWNQTDGHALAGRLDMQHVGMSGHSFGAKTTQAVSGQSSGLNDGLIGGRIDGRATEKRIAAAIALSPSTPRREEAATAFGRVSIPWMLMTGTKDTGMLSDQTVPTRLAVFPALPAGDKYELVLDAAEHSAFTDSKGRANEGTRNPNHHRAIRALSTAFWDSHLRNDESARQWLTGKRSRSVLDPEDRFQWK